MFKGLFQKARKASKPRFSSKRGHFKQVYLRNDRPELVHPWCMRDRLAGVPRFTGEAESLRAMERNRIASLALRGRVGARKCGLFGGLGLGILSRFC